MPRIIDLINALRTNFDDWIGEPPPSSSMQRRIRCCRNERDGRSADAVIAVGNQLADCLAHFGNGTHALRVFLHHLAVGNWSTCLRAWDALLPRLEALADRLQKDGAAGRLTAAEANDKAMSLAGQDRRFVHRSQREWAEAIGCSVGLVSRLPFWNATMQRTGRQRKDKIAAPKVVRLTDSLEAVTGVGGPDEVLNGLIAQQEADYEPSPLDDDPPGSRPKKVRSRNRP